MRTYVRACVRVHAGAGEASVFSSMIVDAHVSEEGDRKAAQDSEVFSLCKRSHKSSHFKVLVIMSRHFPLINFLEFY